MRWDLRLFSSQEGPQQDEDRALFAKNLELLPRAFPSLRQLHVILEEVLYESRCPCPSDNMDEIKAVLLEPLVAASVRLALQDFSVAIPSGLFSSIKSVANQPRTTGAIGRIKNINVWDMQLWYPFTDPQHERGRPGKGVWIKYGPETSFSWRPDGTVMDLRSHASVLL